MSLGRASEVEKRCLADIDVVILAGGLGTRLRSILPDTPKILAPVGGTPFIDILLDRLGRFGARRVILALGHLADQVERHLAVTPRADMSIILVNEPEPLGTAGALRHVRPEIETPLALVVNGDSLVDVDLCAFIAAYRASGAEGAILCTRVADAARYGTVEIDGSSRIAAFREKTGGQGPGTINAGIYVMGRALLDRIEQIGDPSLERDVFQKLPPGTLAAYVGAFAFLDIGTPEDLTRGSEFLDRTVR